MTFISSKENNNKKCLRLSMIRRKNLRKSIKLISTLTIDCITVHLNDIYLIRIVKIKAKEIKYSKKYLKKCYLMRYDTIVPTILNIRIKIIRIEDTLIFNFFCKTSTSMIRYFQCDCYKSMKTGYLYSRE